MLIEVEKCGIDYDEIEAAEFSNDDPFIKESFIINPEISIDMFNKEFIVSEIKKAENDGRLKNVWITEDVEESIRVSRFGKRSLIHNLEFVAYRGVVLYYPMMMVKLSFTNDNEINFYISTMIHHKYSLVEDRNVVMSLPINFRRHYGLMQNNDKPVKVGNFIFILDEYKYFDHCYVFNSKFMNFSSVAVYATPLIISILENGKKRILELLKTNGYPHIKDIELIPNKHEQLD